MQRTSLKACHVSHASQLFEKAATKAVATDDRMRLLGDVSLLQASQKLPAHVSQCRCRMRASSANSHRCRRRNQIRLDGAKHGTQPDLRVALSKFGLRA